MNQKILGTDNQYQNPYRNKLHFMILCNNKNNQPRLTKQPQERIKVAWDKSSSVQGLLVRAKTFNTFCKN